MRILLLLWCLLASSGVVVAQRAPRQLTNPHEWRAHIREFERQDSLAPPALGGIVFVGSSSVRAWGTLAQDFAGYPVRNRGFGGARLPDVNFYFDQVVRPASQPRQVVLYAGDNDLAAGYTVAELMTAFREFDEHLRRAVPQAHLLVLAIKPSPARRQFRAATDSANAQLAAYAAQHRRRVQFVDVATPLLDAHGRPRPAYYRPDSLHLSPAGYAQWTKVVRPRLRR